jgi:hypothetical protein
MNNKNKEKKVWYDRLGKFNVSEYNPPEGIGGYLFRQENNYVVVEETDWWSKKHIQIGRIEVCSCHWVASYIPCMWSLKPHHYYRYDYNFLKKLVKLMKHYSEWYKNEIERISEEDKKSDDFNGSTCLD